MKTVHLELTETEAHTMGYAIYEALCATDDVKMRVRLRAVRENLEEAGMVQPTASNEEKLKAQLKTTRDALAVLIFTPSIVAWLSANDPKALAQAQTAHGATTSTL